MKNVLIVATFAICATAAGAQDLTVEGEDDATYTVLESSTASSGIVNVITRRNEDGVNTYSDHNVSCDPYLIGEIASGATLDSLDENRVSDPELVEMVIGSTEDAIAYYACES